jgi:hypothetical protein
MFNKIGEVRAGFVLAGEAVEEPGSLVVRIGSILLMGSSVGMLTNSPPTVGQAANRVHTLSQPRARATGRARMIVMTYVIKYTKPGQVESSVLLDITKMASAETVRNTAQQIAGVDATLTAVDARP